MSELPVCTCGAAKKVAHIPGLDSSPPKGCDPSMWPPIRTLRFTPFVYALHNPQVEGG